jgi:hypothetical protein
VSAIVSLLAALCARDGYGAPHKAERLSGTTEPAD